MKLEGSVESVEKMEKLLTRSFPATLVKDGSKPFVVFGNEPQRSARFTRKWQLFPPEEKATKLFPRRANVEFYYDNLGNRAFLRISDMGMTLLGQRFTGLVLGDGLVPHNEDEDAPVVIEPEPVVAHRAA